MNLYILKSIEDDKLGRIYQYFFIIGIQTLKYRDLNPTKYFVDLFFIIII